MDDHHLLQLRQAYERRLRVLELKEAQMGLDTPPHVIVEIQDLKKKINDIDLKMQSNSLISTIAPSSFNQSTFQSNRLQQIEVVLQGNFDNLTPEIQGAAIRALAAIMNISTEAIRVTSVSSGSVIFYLEVPEEAAERLLLLFQEKDLIIDEIGIIKVRLIQELDNANNTITNNTLVKEYESPLEKPTKKTITIYMARFQVLLGISFVIFLVFVLFFLFKSVSLQRHEGYLVIAIVASLVLIFLICIRIWNKVIKSTTLSLIKRVRQINIFDNSRYSALPILLRTLVPVVLIIGFLWIVTNPRPLSASAIVSRIHTMNTLVTTAYESNVVINVKEYPLFSFLPAEHVVLKVEGTILAGIDLTQISQADVTVNGGEVTVRIPSAHIVSKDLHSTQLVTDQGVLPGIDPALQPVAEQMGRDKLLQAACTYGILAKTEQATQTALGDLLGNLSGVQTLHLIQQAPGPDEITGCP